MPFKKTPTKIGSLAAEGDQFKKKVCPSFDRHTVFVTENYDQVDSFSKEGKSYLDAFKKKKEFKEDKFNELKAK